VDLAGECPLDRRLGGFSVDIFPKYSIVAGTIADAVNPITVLTPMAT
jgi:hypothetical protein